MLKPRGWDSKTSIFQNLRSYSMQGHEAESVSVRDIVVTVPEHLGSNKEHKHKITK